ncbi:hypothetical protein QQP08_020451 [Theobroma cacao]|nr:hypothetical protein QQP08_020451 [Theobroma cacao]
MDTFGMGISEFPTTEEVEWYSLILYKLILNMNILSAFAATRQRKYSEYSHEEICFILRIWLLHFGDYWYWRSHGHQVPTTFTPLGRFTASSSTMFHVIGPEEQGHRDAFEIESLRL